MTSDRSVLERQMQRVELRPFTLEGFHRQRQRKQRNRRMGTAVVALAVAVAGIGGLVRSFSTGPVPAGDPRSPFLGTWVSTDLDGSTQTMVVRASGDEAVEVVVHDDAASVCSGAPSTTTGTGRLEGATELVIPSPVLTCDDGSEPQALSGPPLEEQLRNLTFVHDPEADTLTDRFGLVWEREGVPTTENGEAVPTKTYSLLDGEVTFVATEPPWHFADYLSGPTVRTLDGGYGGLRVVADPIPVGTGCQADVAPANAEALAARIGSDPDIEATEPIPVDIAGIEALQMDVAPAPGASICARGHWPLLFTSDEPSLFTDIGLGNRASYIRDDEGVRVYLLDVPAGSSRVLAIVVFGSHGSFESMVEAAALVLDSLEFHAS